MPKNDVEEVLSSTADYLEKAIADNPEAQAEFARLINTGQKPHVVRVLNSIPGGSATIVVEKLNAT